MPARAYRRDTFTAFSTLLVTLRKHQREPGPTISAHPLGNCRHLRETRRLEKAGPRTATNPGFADDRDQGVTRDSFHLLPKAAQRNQNRPRRAAGFPLDRLSDIEDCQITGGSGFRQSLDGDVGKRFLEQARLPPSTAIDHTNHAVAVPELSKRRRRDRRLGRQKANYGSWFNDNREALAEALCAEGQAHGASGMTAREVGGWTQVN